MFSTQVEPLYDIFARMGGIFEPSLAVIFSKGESNLQYMVKNNTKWKIEAASKDCQSEPVNINYHFIETSKASKIQIVDNMIFKQDSTAIPNPNNNINTKCVLSSLPFFNIFII